MTEALGLTPSQTAGPYLSIGLLRELVPTTLVDPGDPRAVRIRGRLLDGAGEGVPDGMVEIWQARRRTGRYGDRGRSRASAARGTQDDGSLRVRHREARARRLARRRPAGAAHRCRCLRARAAQAGRDTPLLPGRERGERGGSGPLRACRRRSARRLVAVPEDGGAPVRHPFAGRRANDILRGVTPFDACTSPRSSRDAVSGRAWLAAMLEAERALAEAGAARRRRPRRRGRRDRRGLHGRRFDWDSASRGGSGRGNPAEPLVRALVERVGDDGGPLRPPRGDEPGHRGHAPRCSSRVARLDSSLRRPRARRRRLRGARARAPRHADGGADAAPARRADDVRAQGRRLARRAARRARARLARRSRERARRAARRRRGNALRPRRATASRSPPRFARELGLAEPALPWHANRVRVAELGAALALACGVASGRSASTSSSSPRRRSARSASGDGGGSSAMPHKRNPVGGEWARAAAELARAHASVLTDALVAEHERRAGAWQAEWDALSGALAATGGAAAALRRPSTASRSTRAACGRTSS